MAKKIRAASGLFTVDIKSDNPEVTEALATADAERILVGAMTAALCALIEGAAWISEYESWQNSFMRQMKSDVMGWSLQGKASGPH